MRRKKLCALLLAAILALGLCSCGMSTEKKYNQAVADVEAGNYDKAIEAFSSLNGYEDSGKYILYARCLKAGDGGDYETAIKSLTALGDFKEASLYVKYYTALDYEAAQKYEEAGVVYDGILLFKDAQSRSAALPDKILDRDLAEAKREAEEEDDWDALSEMVGKKYTNSETQMYENIMAFASELHEKQQYEKAGTAYLLLKEEGCEKAEEPFKESAYQLARVLMTDEEYSDARYIINEYLSGYKDADELSKECSYQLALEMEARGAQSAQAAYNAFMALEAYKDSAEHASTYETKYAEAVSKREANEFDAAITLFAKLGSYSDSSDRLAEAENAKTYAEAVFKRESGEFDAAIALFNELGTYLDSSDRLTEARNAKAYASAVSLMNEEKYEKAIEAFRVLKGYSDSAAQIEACEAAILERKYQKAVSLMDEEKYAEAIEAFRALYDYSDSKAQIEACETAILEREYQKAVALEDAQAAYDAFKALGAYKDSADRVSAYEAKYAEAVSKREANEFDAAITLFKELGTYSDSSARLTEAQNAKTYAEAVSKRETGEFDAAITLFTELGGYSDSSGRLSEARNAKTYAEAVSKRETGEFDAAIALFTKLGTYSDSAAQVEETRNAKTYAEAVSLMIDEKYNEAIEVFKQLGSYRDSGEQITECTYQMAEKLRKKQQYAKAYAIYMTIQGYKDVDEIMASDAGIVAQKYRPGSYVTFGAYPQTESGTDNTPIEWLVLESDGETALLISRYALDYQPYNIDGKAVTWEQCTLRSWLNNEFYNRAFSVDEKNSILKSSVSADKNPDYGTNPGKATRDNLFLLSIVEANKYFASDKAKMCAVTDYAIKQGAWTHSDYKADGRLASWWWLRSPGKTSVSAALVDHCGSVLSYGCYVCGSSANGGNAVRPCVRVRLF